jgi:hypothetical protein
MMKIVAYSSVLSRHLPEENSKKERRGITDIIKETNVSQSHIRVNVCLLSDVRSKLKYFVHL